MVTIICKTVKTELLLVFKLEFIFQISKYYITDHLLLQSLSLIFFWQSKLSKKWKHQWYRKIGTHIWRNSCTVFYWVSLYCEMINLPISTCKHKVLSGRDVLAQLWFTFSFLQQALKRTWWDTIILFLKSELQDKFYRMHRNNTKKSIYPSKHFI